MRRGASPRSDLGSGRRHRMSFSEPSFAPPGLLALVLFSHGLRHGLHSYAALRLKPERGGCTSTEHALLVRLSKSRHYPIDKLL